MIVPGKMKDERAVVVFVRSLWLSLCVVLVELEDRAGTHDTSYSANREVVVIEIRYC